LRGISVALALSLPRGPERDIVVTFTFVIAMFSILIECVIRFERFGRSMGRNKILCQIYQ